MKTKVIILAAGIGKRMGSDFPKVVLPVAGVPMITRLLRAVEKSGVMGKPIVVIGHGIEQVCEAVGDAATCVMQHEQLGTGHAVKVTMGVAVDADQVVVLYGDHPFISAKVIQDVVALREHTNATIAMMTTTVPHFDDWYRMFEHWGRIIRNKDQKIDGIHEYKDATKEERAIKELNPGFYCFESKWLWEHIDQLKNKNAQGEFYITDLVHIAVRDGQEIATLPIPPEEAIGVNSKDELAIAEKIAKQLGV